MLEFKEVELEDRGIIQKYLAQERFFISDVSFVNLFLWRKARKIAYAVVCDCLLIQTTYVGEKPFYFFPIGTGDKRRVVELLLEQDSTLEFHSLELAWVEFLREHFAGVFDFELNRDRSDYVYDVQELISLSGRKYHKKKNHLNKFLQTYPQFVFERISVENSAEVLGVWGEWFGMIESPSVGLVSENLGIVEVLGAWGELPIEGGIVRVDGRIVAFSFGEVMSSEMAVIHIEKADSGVAGAYQIINQQLLANVFSHVKYANREEDLGIEGLRRAKMSYNPVFLVEKYEARKKHWHS